MLYIVYRIRDSEKNLLSKILSAMSSKECIVLRGESIQSWRVWKKMTHWIRSWTSLWAFPHSWAQTIASRWGIVRPPWFKFHDTMNFSNDTWGPFYFISVETLMYEYWNDIWVMCVHSISPKLPWLYLKPNQDEPKLVTIFCYKPKTCTWIALDCWRPSCSWHDSSAIQTITLPSFECWSYMLQEYSPLLLSFLNA